MVMSHTHDGLWAICQFFPCDYWKLRVFAAMFWRPISILQRFSNVLGIPVTAHDTATMVVDLSFAVGAIIMAALRSRAEFPFYSLIRVGAVWGGRGSGPARGWRCRNGSFGVRAPKLLVHITVSHCLSVYKKLCRQRCNSVSSVVVMLAWGKVTGE